MVYYILFNSVTNAIKAKEAFSKYGIASKITRPREGLASCSCGYSTEVYGTDRSTLSHIIKSESIANSGVYYEVKAGKFEKVTGV